MTAAAGKGAASFEETYALAQANKAAWAARAAAVDAVATEPPAPVVSTRRPRADPDPALVAVLEETDDTADGLSVRRADGLTVEPVSWLWADYIPCGKLTLLAGPAGVSKTTLAMAIAATITMGGRWPDGGRAQAGDVLVWSGEDGMEDTLLPRLIACGADLTRVHFVGDMREDGECVPFDPALHMDSLLLAALRIRDLAMVIIDPVILAVRGDSNTNGDVRRGLFPLVKLAETTGAAALGITHFSKNTTGRSPVERVTGSLAFAAAARVVLAVARIPEDQGGGRLVVRAKSNLGPDEGGFKFAIRTTDVQGAQVVRVEWGEPVTGNAQDILTKTEQQRDPDERTRGDELVELMVACLNDAGGEMDRKHVLAIAAESGFSERACDRARTRAGITSTAHGFGKARRSLWALKPPLQTDTPSKK